MIRKIKESYFNLNDDLLSGITFNDLIITIESNESEINEKVIYKVFNELIKQNLDDAKYELKKNMNNILKNLI